MRKALLTLIGAVVLALAAPVVALAHGEHHHHHHRHHVRQVVSPPSSDDPVNQSDATVTAYSGGKLTITTADGNAVTGMVVSGTEISCDSSSTTSIQRNHDGGSGDNSGPGSGDRGDRGDQGDDHGDHGDQPGDDRGDHGDEPGDDNGHDGQCSSITTGMHVVKAELDVFGGKAIWREVELLSS